MLKKRGGEKMQLKKSIAIGTVSALMLAAVAFPAFAKPPGEQVFEVYDSTQDGLQVSTDPDTGNVEANANPGGSDRLIVNGHIQKAAPNCTLTVELVRGSAATNGGLDGTGHTGAIQVLGTFITNNVGNGNFHFDIQVGDGTPDTTVYGHIDLEDYSGSCTEADGTTVAVNEYGAAPDPALGIPLNWME